MKILFASDQAFLPQLTGGIEVSTAQLGAELVRQGHEVAVLCRIGHRDIVWAESWLRRKLSGRAFPPTRLGCLQIFRGWDVVEGLEEVRQRWLPDAIIVQGSQPRSFELASRAAGAGMRTWYYAHDVSFIESGRQLPELGRVRWISNSKYTQRVLNSSLGVPSDIVPPCIDAQIYRVNSSREFVTMINPRLSKGGSTTLDIAEDCPDINFLLVEAWLSGQREVQILKQRAMGMTNVTWWPTQPDMRQVYGRTRILIAPSKLHETWGRVVTETQISGIPAIVSDMGALPETVGQGGVVLPADAAREKWARAVRTLYDDATVYQSLADIAYGLGSSGETAPANVVSQLMAALRNDEYAHL